MENLNEFNQVECWYEPTDYYRKNNDFICEMTRDEHGFLCGIIKMIRPRKILEIGVAEGGTTAVIVKCLEMLGLSCEMYSVDLNDKLYNNNDYETGYIFKKQNKPDNIEHKFLFGKSIAGQIENIVGENIDLVILDTTHQIPGEIIDFLSVLPFMAENGMVVMHDINLGYIHGMSEEKQEIKNAYKRIATKILFTTVVAEKYWNYDRMPNIGAFMINENTYKYSLNLFMALSLNWTYKVGTNLLNEYRKVLTQYYSGQCMEVYDMCVNMNNLLSQNFVKFGKDYTCIWEFPYESIPYGSRIVLYGAGFVGRRTVSFLQAINYLQIVCIVDMNYEKYNALDTRYIDVEKPESILEKDFDYVFVTVENENVFCEIKQYIVQNNLNKGKPIIGPVKRLSLI